MGPRNRGYTAVAVGKEQEHDQEGYDKDSEAQFLEGPEQEEEEEDDEEEARCIDERGQNPNTVEESATAGLLAQERKNHSEDRKRRRRQDNFMMQQRPNLWGRMLGWKKGYDTRSMVQVGREREVGESIRLGEDTNRRRFSIDEYPSKRVQRRRGCFVFGLSLLVLLGLLQSITLLTSLLHTIFPSSLSHILSHWGQPHHPGYGLTSYPTDFSRDILPLPLHSHNDYWRRVPLYDAIKAGAIGVEADVWFIDGELYVGHTMAALTRNRTLKSLYVDPLRRILEGQNDRVGVGSGGDGDNNQEDPEKQARGGWNGVFDTKLDQTLTLLIDFKDKKPETFQHVLAQLQPLRERQWLTHVNGSQRIEGPITVVATGDARFEDILNSNPHHDIFFDAPLNSFWDTDSEGPKPLNISTSSTSSSSSSSSSSAEKYTPLNSHYASTSLPKAIGSSYSFFSLTPSQLKTVRAQVKGAQKAGLKARYWDTPFWPIGLRDKIWEQLVEEGGVDILNVDDLKAAAGKDWGKGSKWWKQEGGSR